MITMIIKARLIFAVTIVMLLASPVFAQIVANGSFESDNFTAANGEVSANGAITGWVSTGTTGLGDTTKSWQWSYADNGLIPDGNCVAFLYGTGSSISQTIHGLKENTKYKLHYRDNSQSVWTAYSQVTAKIGNQSIDCHYFNPVENAYTRSTPYYTRNIDFTVPADGDYILSFTQTGVVPSDLQGYHPCSLIDDAYILQWTNSNLAIDDNVPAPWTPLTASNGVINCWNRTYNIGNSALPSQITVGDENLLTGPIELIGASNGQSFDWSNSATTVTQTGQSKMTYFTTAQSAGVKLSSVKACEFDGFMRVDLTLSPISSAKQIDNLSLRIPIDISHAKYRYGYGNAACGGAGTHLPVEQNIIGTLNTPWQSDFLPALWIGDANAGIGWYCEGQQNWSLSAINNALSITSDGTSAVLQVNFIDTPTQLAVPITLSFALQATPVKPFPRPNDWLTYRPVECPGNKMYFEGWGGSTRWGGFPVVGNYNVPDTDPGAFDGTNFKTEIADRHAQGLYLPMYLNAGTMTYSMPQVQTYGSTWHTGPEIAGITNDMGQPITLACPRCKDWVDLFLSNFDYYLSKYNTDAIYMDFAFCQRCNNSAHGCGYDTPSGLKGIWPIFAHRELYKRIYKVIKSARPNSTIVTIGHAGGSLNLPSVNFWDAYVEGEYINVDIRNSTYNGDYTAYYSPERFSTEYSGRPFNSLPLFMGYTIDNNTAQTRTIFAMALMNGSVVWPANIDWTVTYSVYNALDSFGVSDIQEFLPYWDNHWAVAVRALSGVYASVYKKTSKSLIAVSNLSASTQNARLTLNAGELGLAPNSMTVKDAFTGASISLSQGSIMNVSVASKNFRLLVVSGTPSPDATVPKGSISINAGAEFTNSTNVTLALSASDTQSGLYKMRFSNDGSNWSSWVPYTTSKSWTLSGGDGTKTVYVRFKDNAGNISEIESDTINLNSIADAKSQAQGTSVALTESITAVFDGSIYVEAANRTSGIRVDKASHGFTIADTGKTVTITGTVQKDPDTAEIYISASDITPANQTNLILPLGLTNKALGGGSFNNQIGVNGGTGTNNIGLLIRTTGIASNIGANGFTLSDGSGVAVTVYAAGISSAYEGKYVTVTGISSIGSDGERVIKAQSTGNVQAVN